MAERPCLGEVFKRASLNARFNVLVLPILRLSMLKESSSKSIMNMLRPTILTSIECYASLDKRFNRLCDTSQSVSMQIAEEKILESRKTLEQCAHSNFFSC